MHFGRNIISKTVYPTDEEFEVGIALGNAEYEREQHAVRAVYERERDAIVIDLHTGVTLSIPRRLMQGLENGTPSQLEQIEISSLGDALHWPALDADFLVDPLTRGVLGSARWMSELGKKGGAARSPRKAVAVRENGNKGGRPRKKAVQLDTHA